MIAEIRTTEDKNKIEVDQDRASLNRKTAAVTNASEHFPKIERPAYAKSRKTYAKQNFQRKDVSSAAVMGATREISTTSMSTLRNNTLTTN